MNRFLGAFVVSSYLNVTDINARQPLGVDVPCHLAGERPVYVPGSLGLGGLLAPDHILAGLFHATAAFLPLPDVLWASGGHTLLVGGN